MSLNGWDSGASSRHTHGHRPGGFGRGKGVGWLCLLSLKKIRKLDYLPLVLGRDKEVSFPGLGIFANTKQTLGWGEAVTN